MARTNTFAQLLVSQLRDMGVERIYGVVGDSLNPVVDAVRTTDGIEWVHVRNEEAGAFAAGASSSAPESSAPSRTHGPTSRGWPRATASPSTTCR